MTTFLPKPGGRVRPGRTGDVRRSPRVAVIMFVLLVAVVFISPLFLPSPIAPDPSSILASPSMSAPLGTDQLGRDLLARVMSGMRLDLVLGVAALAAPLLLGSLLGALAGWYGGWVDEVIGVLADVIQAFPYYLFIIVLAFFLGAGATSIFVAVAAVAWVSYMRIVRAEVQSALRQDYIHAAIGAGYTDWRILWRHLLPNVFKQPLTYAVTDVVVVIVSTATLSYLGVGIAPPTPELGALVADGQQFTSSHPLLTIAPGVAILIIGAAFAFFGNRLSQRLEGS